MSLQLEQTDLTQPQDRDDLLKIYTGDHFPAMHLPLLQSCTDASRLLHALREHEELQCYAARFNDRLIAACIVCQHGNGIADIDAPGIRPSSAGRGVEARLLRMVMEKLAPQLDAIRLHLDSHSRELADELHVNGFDRDSDWHEEILFRRRHARS